MCPKTSRREKERETWRHGERERERQGEGSWEGWGVGRERPGVLILGLFTC